MKYIFISILIVVGLSSCSIVQVMYTNPTSELIKEDNGQFYYEDDTIKILYSFWEENGIMAFSIFNKLNVPIYVDWKKSSFISYGVKSNYYSENEVVETKGKSVNSPYLFKGTYDWSRWYQGDVNTWQSNSVVLKDERIMFLPPKASTGKAKYKLTNGYANMDNAYNKKVGDDKQIKVRVLDIDKDSTDFFFRNFITYSTKESFDNEYYINNEFYIRKVVEVAPSYLDGFARANRFYVKRKKE